MNARRFLAAVLAVLVSAPLVAQTPVQRSAEDAEFLKGAYLPADAGVEHPKLLTDVKPKYTADAMRAKIQGDVEIQVVVNVKGEVERARVSQSLDKVFGLDNEALAAARQFRFEAGTLNGKPVPVAVTLHLTFRLR
jgi:periplasmic protein TonB